MPREEELEVADVRAAIYARMSTDKQNDRSLDDQVAERESSKLPDESETAQ